MYNNPDPRYPLDSSWDSAAADRAKKSTLGLIGLQLISTLLGLYRLFTLNPGDLRQQLANQPGATEELIAQVETMLPTMRTAFLIVYLIVALLILWLLWSKIKKLDTLVVPSRGIYFFLGIVSLLGLMGAIGAANTLAGILNLMFVILTIVLSVMAIMAIGALRRNFVNGSPNNPQRAYTARQPMKDNLNNSTEPETVVYNDPEVIEPNYNSNSNVQHFQEVVPNHQPVNNLDRNQLLDTDPAVTQIPDNHIAGNTNEDPRSGV